MEEAIPDFARKKQLAGLTIEEKTQPWVEPRAAKEFQIGEGGIEIEGRKHGEGMVEFFDASTVVRKEKTVDEGSFASGEQDIVGAMRRGACEAERRDGKLGHRR
ncbi:MAG TPA: hypothetical protein VJN92_19655 [Candidatus Acidoferrum sp.]|nr:hypothetical protein [Candidatus Acidoferrum sp.]